MLGVRLPPGAPFQRAWPSGQAAAFQAADAGSIPAARSIFSAGKIAMAFCSTQFFVPTGNPPGFTDGLLESHLFGVYLREKYSNGHDRNAFESAMRAAGVGVMNFRRWVTDDYVIPAVEMAWLGWLGSPAPV